MAHEIEFGFTTGKTLAYGVLIRGGSVRTDAGTSLPEIGSTGYYVADNIDIQPSDIVIVKEGSVVVGAGEYNKLADDWTDGGRLDVLLDGIHDNVRTTTGEYHLDSTGGSSAGSGTNLDDDC